MVNKNCANEPVTGFVNAIPVTQNGFGQLSTLLVALGDESQRMYKTSDSPGQRKDRKERIIVRISRKTIDATKQPGKEGGTATGQRTEYFVKVDGPEQKHIGDERRRLSEKGHDNETSTGHHKETGCAKKKMTVCWKNAASDSLGQAERSAAYLELLKMERMLRKKLKSCRQKERECRHLKKKQEQQRDGCHNPKWMVQRTNDTKLVFSPLRTSSTSYIPIEEEKVRTEQVDSRKEIVAEKQQMKKDKKDEVILKDVKEENNNTLPKRSPPSRDTQAQDQIKGKLGMKVAKRRQTVRSPKGLIMKALRSLSEMVSKKKHKSESREAEIQKQKQSGTKEEVKPEKGDLAKKNLQPWENDCLEESNCAVKGVEICDKEDRKVSARLVHEDSHVVDEKKSPNPCINNSEDDSKSEGRSKSEDDRNEEEDDRNEEEDDRNEEEDDRNEEEDDRNKEKDDRNKEEDDRNKKEDDRSKEKNDRNKEEDYRNKEEDDRNKEKDEVQSSNIESDDNLPSRVLNGETLLNLSDYDIINMSSSFAHMEMEKDGDISNGIPELKAVCALVDEVVNISKDKVAHISEDKVAHISEDEVAYICKDEVAHISEDEVARISEDEVAHISEDEVAHISEDEVAHISEDEVAHISEDGKESRDEALKFCCEQKPVEHIVEGFKKLEISDDDMSKMRVAVSDDVIDQEESSTNLNVTKDEVLAGVERALENILAIVENGFQESDIKPLPANTDEKAMWVITSDEMVESWEDENSLMERKTDSRMQDGGQSVTANGEVKLSRNSISEEHFGASERSPIAQTFHTVKEERSAQSEERLRNVTEKLFATAVNSLVGLSFEHQRVEIRKYSASGKECFYAHKKKKDLKTEEVTQVSKIQQGHSFSKRDQVGSGNRLHPSKDRSDFSSKKMNTPNRKCNGPPLEIDQVPSLFVTAFTAPIGKHFMVDNRDSLPAKEETVGTECVSELPGLSLFSTAFNSPNANFFRRNEVVTGSPPKVDDQFTQLAMEKKSFSLITCDRSAEESDIDSIYLESGISTPELMKRLNKQLDLLASQSLESDDESDHDPSGPLEEISHELDLLRGRYCKAQNDSGIVLASNDSLGSYVESDVESNASYNMELDELLTESVADEQGFSKESGFKNDLIFGLDATLPLIVSIDLTHIDRLPTKMQSSTFARHLGEPVVAMLESFISTKSGAADLTGDRLMKQSGVSVGDACKEVSELIHEVCHDPNTRNVEKQSKGTSKRKTSEGHSSQILKKVKGNNCERKTDTRAKATVNSVKAKSKIKTCNGDAVPEPSKSKSKSTNSQFHDETGKSKSDSVFSQYIEKLSKVTAPKLKSVKNPKPNKKKDKISPQSENCSGLHKIVHVREKNTSAAKVDGNGKTRPEVRTKTNHDKENSIKKSTSSQSIIFKSKVDKRGITSTSTRGVKTKSDARITMTELATVKGKKLSSKSSKGRKRTEVINAKEKRHGKSTPKTTPINSSEKSQLSKHKRSLSNQPIFKSYKSPTKLDLPLFSPKRVEGTEMRTLVCKSNLESFRIPKLSLKKLVEDEKSVGGKTLGSSKVKKKNLHTTKVKAFSKERLTAPPGGEDLSLITSPRKCQATPSCSNLHSTNIEKALSIKTNGEMKYKELDSCEGVILGLGEDSSSQICQNKNEKSNAYIPGGTTTLKEELDKEVESDIPCEKASRQDHKVHPHPHNTPNVETVIVQDKVESSVTLTPGRKEDMAVIDVHATDSDVEFVAELQESIVSPAGSTSMNRRRKRKASELELSPVLSLKRLKIPDVSSIQIQEAEDANLFFEKRDSSDFSHIKCNDSYKDDRTEEASFALERNAGNMLDSYIVIDSLSFSDTTPPRTVHFKSSFINPKKQWCSTPSELYSKVKPLLTSPIRNAQNAMLGTPNRSANEGDLSSYIMIDTLLSPLHSASILKAETHLTNTVTTTRTKSFPHTTGRIVQIRSQMDVATSPRLDGLNTAAAPFPDQMRSVCVGDSITSPNIYVAPEVPTCDKRTNDTTAMRKDLEDRCQQVSKESSVLTSHHVEIHSGFKKPAGDSEGNLASKTVGNSQSCTVKDGGCQASIQKVYLPKVCEKGDRKLASKSSTSTPKVCAGKALDDICSEEKKVGQCKVSPMKEVGSHRKVILATKISSETIPTLKEGIVRSGLSTTAVLSTARVIRKAALEVAEGVLSSKHNADLFESFKPVQSILKTSSSKVNSSGSSQRTSVSQSSLDTQTLTTSNSNKYKPSGSSQSAPKKVTFKDRNEKKSDRFHPYQKKKLIPKAVSLKFCKFLPLPELQDLMQDYSMSLFTNYNKTANNDQFFHTEPSFPARFKTLSALRHSDDLSRRVEEQETKTDAAQMVTPKKKQRVKELDQNILHLAANSKTMEELLDLDQMVYPLKSHMEPSKSPPPIHPRARQMPHYLPRMRSIPRGAPHNGPYHYPFQPNCSYRKF